MPVTPTPQPKPRSIFSSCINHLTDLTNINNLRQIQATYDPRQAPETLKLQLLIKAQKSLIFDTENTSRDSQSVSKQLYLWSHEQSDRAIQDVGDRLAYMTYQIGDVQSQFSKSLEQSRGDLKQIRNLENELIKLRDRGKTLQVQINKAHQDDRHKNSEATEKMVTEHANIEERMREITSQLPKEKRRLMKSSYQSQFEAYQELADKLSMISHFGQLLLHELNDDPTIEYDGQDRTANIKGQAANSLGQYRGPSKGSKPLETDLANQLELAIGFSGLHRADTRKFGETHPHILTNASDGMNPNSSQVGVTHPASLGIGNLNVSDSGDPSGWKNAGGEDHRNESGGSSMKPGGSIHPPKLPERPKVENQGRLVDQHGFPVDQKVDPYEEQKKPEDPVAGGAFDHPPPAHTFSAEPATSPTLLDQPPAYSLSRSGKS